MSILPVLNALEISPFALAPLAGGSSPIARALERSKAALGSPGALIVCRPEWRERILSASGGAEIACLAEGGDREAFFRLLAERAADHEAIAHLWADSPFVDGPRTADLLAMHAKWKAQYSFADGFPEGLIPEIIDPRLLGALAELARKAPGGFDRDFAFQVLSKDINAFDVETLVSKVDMRPHRIRLFCDSTGPRLLAERFIARGAEDAASMLGAIETDPLILRTRPAYLSVQVAAGCPQACPICPWPLKSPSLLSDRGEMPAEAFLGLVRRARDFSGRIVVSPSLWGEASLHSGIAAIALGCLAMEGVDLLIETSGIGWKPADLDRILAASSALPPEKLRWIVSLDAASEGVYRKLRGEGFAEANAFADRLLSASPEAAWVQAVRTLEGEEDLEAFWKAWKARTDKVIIQKYDHFSGYLPDRRVTDISPLERHACWHSRRDLAVLIDGRVPFCKEDLRGEEWLGNAFQDELAEIWERGGARFADHSGKRYGGICQNCDEHYTYNF